LTITGAPPDILGVYSNPIDSNAEISWPDKFGEKMNVCSKQKILLLWVYRSALLRGRREGIKEEGRIRQFLTPLSNPDVDIEGRNIHPG